MKNKLLLDDIISFKNILSHLKGEYIRFYSLSIGFRYPFYNETDFNILNSQVPLFKLDLRNSKKQGFSTQDPPIFY